MAASNTETEASKGLRPESEANGVGCRRTRNDSYCLDGDEEMTAVDSSPDGRYLKFSAMVGSGSFKTVYKGLDTETGVAVAWCELQSKHFRKGEYVRFKEEAQMMKILVHPNILRFHDYFELPSEDKKHPTLVLVTELMTSGSLRAYLKRFRGVQKNKMIKNWGLQILKGMKFLHKHNPPIIHRDLKCENIFVTGPSGVVKIGDLGLAVLKNRSHAESVIGTPEFMAPEMYEQHYNEAIDIYAFGMCLLEMVTLQYPYEECQNAAQIFKRVTTGVMPEALAKVECVELKDLILKCLRTDISERCTLQQIVEHEFFRDELFPVMCKRQSAGCLELVLTIDNDQIHISYKINEDTAEKVVQDMISKNMVKDSQAQRLIRTILSGIASHVTGDKDAASGSGSSGPSGLSSRSSSFTGATSQGASRARTSSKPTVPAVDEDKTSDTTSGAARATAASTTNTAVQPARVEKTELASDSPRSTPGPEASSSETPLATSSADSVGTKAAVAASTDKVPLGQDKESSVAAVSAKEAPRGRGKSGRQRGVKDCRLTCRRVENGTVFCALHYMANVIEFFFNLDDDDEKDVARNLVESDIILPNYEQKITDMVKKVIVTARQMRENAAAPSVNIYPDVTQTGVEASTPASATESTETSPVEQNCVSEYCGDVESSPATVHNAGAEHSCDSSLVKQHSGTDSELSYAADGDIAYQCQYSLSSDESCAGTVGPVSRPISSGVDFVVDDMECCSTPKVPRALPASVVDGTDSPEAQIDVRNCREEGRGVSPLFDWAPASGQTEPKADEVVSGCDADKADVAVGEPGVDCLDGGNPSSDHEVLASAEESCTSPEPVSTAEDSDQLRRFEVADVSEIILDTVAAPPPRESSPGSGSREGCVSETPRSELPSSVPTTSSLTWEAPSSSDATEGCCLHESCVPSSLSSLPGISSDTSSTGAAAVAVSGAAFCTASSEASDDGSDDGSDAEILERHCVPCNPLSCAFKPISDFSDESELEEYFTRKPYSGSESSGAYRPRVTAPIAADEQLQVTQSVAGAGSFVVLGKASEMAETVAPMPAMPAFAGSGQPTTTTGQVCGVHTEAAPSVGSFSGGGSTATGLHPVQASSTTVMFPSAGQPVVEPPSQASQLASSPVQHQSIYNIPSQVQHAGVAPTASPFSYAQPYAGQQQLQALSHPQASLPNHIPQMPVQLQQCSAPPACQQSVVRQQQQQTVAHFPAMHQPLPEQQQQHDSQRHSVSHFGQQQQQQQQHGLALHMSQNPVLQQQQPNHALYSIHQPSPVPAQTQMPCSTAPEDYYKSRSFKNFDAWLVYLHSEFFPHLSRQHFDEFFLQNLDFQQLSCRLFVEGANLRMKQLAETEAVMDKCLARNCPAQPSQSYASPPNQTPVLGPGGSSVIGGQHPLLCGSERVASEPTAAAAAANPALPCSSGFESERPQQLGHQQPSSYAHVHRGSLPVQLSSQQCSSAGALASRKHCLSPLLMKQPSYASACSGNIDSPSVEAAPSHDSMSARSRTRSDSLFTLHSQRSQVGTAARPHLVNQQDIQPPHLQQQQQQPPQQQHYADQQTEPQQQQQQSYTARPISGQQHVYPDHGLASAQAHRHHQQHLPFQPLQQQQQQQQQVQQQPLQLAQQQHQHQLQLRQSVQVQHDLPMQQQQQQQQHMAHSQVVQHVPFVPAMYSQLPPVHSIAQHDPTGPVVVHYHQQQHHQYRQLDGAVGPLSCDSSVPYRGMPPAQAANPYGAQRPTFLGARTRVHSVVESTLYERQAVVCTVPDGADAAQSLAGHEAAFAAPAPTHH